MKIKRLILAVALSILSLLVVAAPVIAAIAYSATITVTNANASSYTYLPISQTFSTTSLIANNYLTSTGLDAKLKQGSTSLPLLLTDDKLLTVLTSLPANNNVSLTFSTANTPVASMPIIVGTGGYITTDDDAALEFGSDFVLTVNGYFNLATGSNKNILYKEHAIRFYMPQANMVEFAILDGSDAEVTYVVNSPVASGVHTIVISGNGALLSMQVDGGGATTTAIGLGIPDVSTDLVWNTGNIMPYINYITLETVQ